MQKFIPQINNINSLQIFQILQFSSAILIGILLAKSGLATEQISIYEALMFIGSLFCFFWIVGGQNSLLQLFPNLDENGKKRALFNVFVLFSVIGLVTGSVLFLTKDFIAIRLTNFAELPHLELLALFLIFNCPAFLVHINYLLLKQYRQIVIFGSISFGTQIIVVVVPLLLGFGLGEVMWGLIAWAIAKYIWALWFLANNAKWEFDKAFWRAYLPLLLPLLLLAFISKGSEYVSGLVVTTLFEDEKAFAVFRYGAREFPLAVLMVGALATSLLPEISENLELGLAKIKETTRRLSHLLFPLSIAAILASPFLFPVIFNEDFSESARVFNIFTLLLTSRILMPQIVLLSQKRNYILTLTALIELLILIGLSIWLGRLFGLNGIAAAVAIAFIIERIILITYTWKVLHIAPQRYIDWKSWLGYNAVLYLGFWISLQIG